MLNFELCHVVLYMKLSVSLNCRGTPKFLQLGGTKVCGRRGLFLRLGNFIIPSILREKDKDLSRSTSDSVTIASKISCSKKKHLGTQNMSKNTRQN